jgi:renalase
MTVSTNNTVAVIGAGLSGLACARALGDAGFRVVVFDKSRGIGGRLATRRAEFGSFDHGAQYFTARDPLFLEQVGQWLASGHAAAWTPRLIAIDAAGATCTRSAVADSTARHVGVPAMNAIGKALAAGLEIRTDCAIVEARRTDDGWRLATAPSVGAATGTTVDGAYDWLIGALPSPQAAQLFAHAEPLRVAALARPMVPCWAVLARFAAPLPLDFDAAFVNGSALTWVARNNSKPGREAPECWVLHAARDWSAAELERAPQDVVAPLLAEFARVIGTDVAPLHAQAHRWRYSGPAAAGGDACLFDAQWRAGACGDWLAGARVEGAWLSGRALAAQVIAAR